MSVFGRGSSGQRHDYIDGVAPYGKARRSYGAHRTSWLFGAIGCVAWAFNGERLRIAFAGMPTS